MPLEEIQRDCALFCIEKVHGGLSDGSALDQVLLNMLLSCICR